LEGWNCEAFLGVNRRTVWLPNSESGLQTS